MYFASTITDIFSNNYVQILVTIIGVIVVQAIVARAIAQIIKKTVRGSKYASSTEKKNREDTLIRIFRTASGVALWIIGLVIILGELHVNIAALATGAGLIGIIVGLGAQNVVKDFLGGIFVILEDQYRVGDIVMFSASSGMGSGVSGVVEDISIRVTRLRDLDGNLHTVSNGSAGIVTNMSHQYANVNIDVGVGYDSDIDKVKDIINEIGGQLEEDPKWQDNIIEPIKFLRLDSFGDSSIQVKAVGRVKPAQQWGVAGEFRERIKKAFEKNGITIPFPQLVVHQGKKD